MKRRLVRNPVVAMILVIAMIISLGTTVLSGIALAASPTTADTTAASASASAEVIQTAPAVETPVVSDPVVELVTAPEPTTPVVDPVVEAPAPVVVEPAPVAPATDAAPTAPAKTEVSALAVAPTVTSAVVSVYAPAITSLGITPSHGPAGTPITVEGTYTGGANRGNMSLETTWLNYLTTVSDGSFSGTTAIPGGTAAGDHVVVVYIVGDGGGNGAVATFTVDPPADPVDPPCTLTGSVSPGSGVAGTIVTVNATSSGGTTGTLMVRWFEGAADTSWGNVSVLSGDYSVSVPLTVPADASLGTHTVKMWNGCQMYTTTFEVTAPTTPTTPTDPVIGDPATSPPTDPAVTPAPSQAVVTADTTPAQEEVVVSSSPVTGVNLAILMIYALVLGAAGILVLRRSQTKSAKH